MLRCLHVLVAAGWQSRYVKRLYSAGNRTDWCYDGELNLVFEAVVRQPCKAWHVQHLAGFHMVGYMLVGKYSLNLVTFFDSVCI